MTAQAIWRAGLARCGNATALWLAAAALLAALTLLAFTHLRQFETVATPWPFDPAFATIADGTAPDRGPGDAPAGWQVEGDAQRDHGRGRHAAAAQRRPGGRGRDPPALAARRARWPAHLPAVGDRGQRCDRRARATAFASARSRWSPTRISSGPTSIRCTGWPGCAARKAAGASMSTISSSRARHGRSSWPSGCATPPASCGWRTCRLVALGERPWFGEVRARACRSPGP